MEQHFSRKLELLRINYEDNDLIFAVESLLTHAQRAHETEVEENKLHIFTDTPKLTQAVWKGVDTANKYYPDSLGISVFEDAFIVGLHSSECSSPRRYVSVGSDYANYSEQGTTRTVNYERPLDEEHLAIFGQHLEVMAARLELADVLSSQNKN